MIDITKIKIPKERRKAVFKKYAALVFHRRHFNVLNKIDSSPLPKKVYGKRRHGKKKVVQSKTNKLSKAAFYRSLSMKEYMKLSNAEKEFAEALVGKKKNDKSESKRETSSDTGSQTTVGQSGTIQSDSRGDDELPIQTQSDS